jgi:hypothetical protein
MMTEQTITQQDRQLIEKLDDLGDVLSASERTLLLAVFTLAAQAVQAKMRAGYRRATAKASRAPAAPGIGAISQSTGALPSLDGFRNTFKAVGNNAFTIRDNNTAAGGVGIGIIW